MTLKAQLDNDLKESMRAKDTVRMETIRNVKSAILAKEVDGGKALDDAAITAIIRSLIKQRDDSIEQYKQGGRSDLVDKEQREKDLLAAYLPAAPDAATTQAAVDKAIQDLGATSMRDMGKVMQAVTSSLGGGVDTKLVSELVKGKLSSK